MRVAAPTLEKDPMFPMDPDEVRAAMAQASMEASLKVHTFNEMLDGMTTDQLKATAAMFEGCMQSPHIAGQIYGQITAILRVAHNTCHCGQDHAAQFSVDKAIETFTGVPTSARGGCNCDGDWHGHEHVSNCPRSDPSDGGKPIDHPV